MISIAGAALWLTLIGTAFGLAALVWIGRSAAIMAAVVGVAAGLCAIAIATIRRVNRFLPGMLPLTDTERRNMRRFGLIVAGEVVLIVIANRVCSAYARSALIGPVDITIVGLHFIPLAAVFRIPRYFWAGCVLSVVPFLTVLLVPEATTIGHALVWSAVPSLVFCGTLWLTAIGNLREVWTVAGLHKADDGQKAPVGLSR